MKYPGFLLWTWGLWPKGKWAAFPRPQRFAAHAHPLCFTFFPREMALPRAGCGVRWLTSAHQGSRHSWTLAVARAWGHGRSWGPQVPLVTETSGCGSAETSDQIRDSGGVRESPGVKGPEDGCLLTLRTVGALLSPGPPGPAGAAAPARQPPPPTWPASRTSGMRVLGRLANQGPGLQTRAGKPFLVNFSQGARKLVITLCRAEMKQADRLYLITM